MDNSANQTFTAHELARAGRELKVPFRIRMQADLRGEAELVCHEILRLLPGKRIVCRASIGERTVLAKLFVEAGNAARHLERELQGVEALRRASILTPATEGQATFESGGTCLLFEFLGSAQSLGECWDLAEGDVQRIEILGSALEVIANMHAAGLCQSDIHLDNFLLSDGALYCIDGADVVCEAQGTSLAEESARQNLGLFFAQLYPRFDHLIAECLDRYSTTLDCGELLSETRVQREKRQQHFLKKTYRECSAFVCDANWRRFTVFDRTYDTPAFRAVLQDPDQALVRGESLKKGNTATVGMIEVDGRQLVLKRYNIKSLWHAVQRAIQPTRASISWRNGHMLGFLGIPTPRPVALVEERFGPFRSRAFLLAESVAGAHALEYFTSDAHPEAERNRLGCQIIEILEALFQAQISHGDLKATNILVPGDGPQLIDLDAMKQHHAQQEFRRAFGKDLDRFIRNWQDSERALDQFLPEIDSLRARLEQ